MPEIKVSVKVTTHDVASIRDAILSVYNRQCDKESYSNMAKVIDEALLLVLPGILYEAFKLGHNFRILEDEDEPC